MRPSSGSSKPAIRLRVVLFPQPDGPSRVTNAPGAIDRCRSRTTAVCPRIFVTPTRFRTGGTVSRAAALAPSALIGTAALPLDLLVPALDPCRAILVDGHPVETLKPGQVVGTDRQRLR